MMHLCKEHQLPPPLCSLNAEELEDLVVRHIRYRSNLMRGKVTLSALRVQEVQAKFRTHFLVPGGRWLFTVGLYEVFCWGPFG